MKTTYHAIIAGGSPDFRNRLKHILNMAEKEANDFSLVIFEALTMDDFELELDNHADIAFVDSGLVIKESKRLAGAWKKTKAECPFALLLSDSHASELKDVIYEMEKQNSLPAEVHILKNNYPDELMMRVVLRMIELGCTEKNLAVV